jgi:hypothetical protein
MGIGYRIFIIEENGTLKRLPSVRLQRLLRYEPKESLPEYAGKRVRCATVLLEVAGRKPISIIHTDYWLLLFDAKGQIDSDEWKSGLHFFMDMAFSSNRETKRKSHGKIIDARNLFPRRRFLWEPNLKIEKAIEDVIFGKKIL